MTTETETLPRIENAFAGIIARETGLKATQVKAADTLFAEGSTVPFVARYRKEATGGVEDDKLELIYKRRAYFLELAERRDAILASIAEQGKLTEDLEKAIRAVLTKQELEDLYLPYKPKRKTRAQAARERGLEPLADALLENASSDVSPTELATQFVNEEKAIETAEAALTGARDIIAERLSDTAEHRSHLRKALSTRGQFKVQVVSGKEKKGAVYRDYFDHSEPLAKAPSHRLLAILRGEREGILSATLEIDDEAEIKRLADSWKLPLDTPCGLQIMEATQDGYKRLLRPSIVNEVRGMAREQAEAEAIRVFRDNLEALLLQSPLGQVPVMGIDPGYRTGCKVAVVNKTGKVVATSTIFPTPPKAQPERAAATIREFTERYGIRAIAIGNGTGSRETEVFTRRALEGKKAKPATESAAAETADATETAAASTGAETSPPGDVSPAESTPKQEKEQEQEQSPFKDVIVAIVPETGASIYSASALARKELPELDVSLRGAVSIARRLQDPLAELVKIDPKSLGVGQYQHDVNQKSLGIELDLAVEGVVNRVGVELNTASPALLKRVSGLSERLANNLVAFRDEKGSIPSRQELLKVTGFGPKTFEQAAGFLRIRGEEPTLDATAVHPERYNLVEGMASELHVSMQDLIGNPQLVSKVEFSKFIDEKQGIGEFTLNDIRAELERPGRDPRPEFLVPTWREDVQKVDDLKPDMILEGRVSNVTNFGAFVDIGVKRDGLVHLSELSHRWVKDPREVVHVGQIIKVKVLEVDQDRDRITLSMKALQPHQEPRRGKKRRRPKARGAGRGAAKPTGDRPPRKPGRSEPRKKPPRPAKETSLEELLDKFKRRW